MRSLRSRLVCAALALTMLIPALSGCNGTTAETTTATTTATTTTETTTEAPVVQSVAVSAENIKTVKLVRADNLKNDSAEVKLYTAFYTQLKETFSVAPQYVTDFALPNKPFKEEDIEIIVGQTTRPTSTAFYEKLSAMDTPAYGISVSGNKISVTGTGIYLTYLALDHLLTELVTQDESGLSILTLADGFEWIETAETEFPDPVSLLSSGRKCAFYTLGKITDPPKQGNYKVMQGGGTDGKYAYYGLIDKSTTPETAIIHKYDIETWELVATSQPMPSAHTNDITYDSKNHRLVISYCSATDGYLGIVTVNPDTLEFIEYIKAPTVSRAVAYLPKTNQYVFATNYTYYITDDQFNTVRSFKDGFPKLTSQGCDCDGTLIYDPRWDSSAKVQTVSINSLSGTFIDAVPLYYITGEPENIFRDSDNTFVMACNSTVSIYRLALLYDTWWE